MAYNNNFYPQYYQQPQQPMMAQPQQQIQQSSGFVSVPSEEVARNYPVAPGNSISFKNENAPYVYTKTMGFSQFDQPIFKKYKLIEEVSDMPIQAPKTNESINVLDYVKRSEFEAIQTDIEAIKKEVAELRDGV